LEDPHENIKLFYILNFLRNLIPICPVYVLLFQSKGLSLGEISLLLAIWAVPAVVLEIPTGILADNWNRKHMLTLGFLLNAAGFMLWYFSEGFALFALGFILWGISESFFSGTFEGLLFDTLKACGKEDEFDRIYGRANFFAGISMAISMFTGGFLSATLGMGNALLLSVLSVMGGFLVSFFLKEVNYYHSKTGKKQGLRQGMKTLKEAALFLTGQHKILLVALAGILIVGIANIIDEYDPLIAESFRLDLTWIGIWEGCRLLLGALGSRIAWRVKGLAGRLRFGDIFGVIWTLSIVSAICMGIFGLRPSWLLLPLYGLFYLIMASAEILVEDWLQQKIEEQGRATVHSLFSLAFGGYGILFCSVFAVVMPEFMASRVLMGVSAYMLLACLAMGAAYRVYVRKGTRG